MWDWLDDEVVRVERLAAVEYISDQLAKWYENGFINKQFELDPMAATLLHLDKHVLKKIEELMR